MPYEGRSDVQGGVRTPKLRTSTSTGRSTTSGTIRRGRITRGFGQGRPGSSSAMLPNQTGSIRHTPRCSVTLTAPAAEYKFVPGRVDPVIGDVIDTNKPCIFGIRHAHSPAAPL